MYTYTVLLLVAFIVAYGTTPLVERLALWLDAVDHPGHRKVHTGITPRLGGGAIFAAVFLPQTALLFLDNHVTEMYWSSGHNMWALAGTSTVIFLLGAWDDIRGLGAPIKLTVQILAAVLLFAAGFRVEQLSNPFGDTITLGMLSAPVTVLWLVGITNALNFVDGIDGAAAGIAAISAFAIANGAPPDQAVVTWVTASCLMGASVGFLFHNFHPARIFMGDSGSMFIGFLLGAVSILSTQKSTAALTMAVPLAALAIPISDIVLAVVRRALRRQPLMVADGHHLHHRLMAHGISHRTAALILYGLCGVSGMVAITLAHSRRETSLLAAVFLFLLLVVIFKGIGALNVSRSDETSKVETAGEREKVAPPATEENKE